MIGGGLTSELRTYVYIQALVKRAAYDRRYNDLTNGGGLHIHVYLLLQAPYKLLYKPSVHACIIIMCCSLTRTHAHTESVWRANLQRKLRVGPSGKNNKHTNTKATHSLCPHRRHETLFGREGLVQNTSRHLRYGAALSFTSASEAALPQP